MFLEGVTLFEKILTVFILSVFSFMSIGIIYLMGSSLIELLQERIKRKGKEKER